MTGGWTLHNDRDGWSAEHPDTGRQIYAYADGTVSDTFHTFDELYRHRALLTAVLFQQFARAGRHDVHKAPNHADGSKIDGYFIVMAELPTGQISYHYPNDDWNRFDVPARARSNEWDGHTSADVLDRLERFLFLA